MEHKAAPAFLMGIDGRTVTGIAAVHGNVDDGGDRSYPGVFGDFTVNGRSRARFLWQHDSNQPPIATIDQVYEVGRADLPDAVLKYAPNATGGTAVKRTYLEDAFADRVFGGVRSGAITEMSYAYDAKDFKHIEEGDRLVRDIYKAEVYDWSDVNWGMNPATSADGQKGLDWKVYPFAAHSDAVEAALAAYTKRARELKDIRAKEGRVLSGENRKRIESAVEALAGATDALKNLLTATEPQKTGGRAETNQLRALWAQQQQRIRELGVPLI
jgi:predicted RNase H-like nuclease (RuvC/YqgF family)